MDVRKLVFLVLAACGGDVFVGVDGGGGACPSGPPSAGATCTGTAKCEYGTNPNPLCDQMFVCNGAWADQSAGLLCPSQSKCPSFSDIQVGQDCSDNTLTCAYPQAECICTQYAGGLVSQQAKWACFPAQTNCPTPRPNLGTACSVPDQTCNYGSCSGGVMLACQNGIWQEAAVACPK